MPLWELYSYFYDLFLRNWFPYKQLVADLNHALDIKEGERILDAGCGPGALVETIITRNSGKAIEVVGLDVSPGMIKLARKRCRNMPNVKIQVGDLNNSLDFPDASFSKVVCSNTLYALENPQETLAEFRRVLEPGGMVIIANPKPDAGLHDLIVEHLRTLANVTPFYMRAWHTAVFVLLLPVSLVVSAINRVIIRKAKRERFHFLEKDDLETILMDLAFRNIEISSCYVDQDWLVTAMR